MLSYQWNAISNCVNLLKSLKDQEQIEEVLNKTFEQASDDAIIRERAYRAAET